MPDEAVVDIDVRLSIDSDVWIAIGSVGQVIEGEDYGAIGRVFKGHNAGGDMAILDLVEDICPRGNQ